MNKPKPIAGLRHVALNVQNFEACEQFYTDLIGMRVEWRPDVDNLYLTSGNDNLALHRAKTSFQPTAHQRLDHIGFILNDINQVDEWYEFLKQEKIVMKSEPRTHRDGARSFYCEDPDGNLVQIIYLAGVGYSL
jgi:catechol 2,3-dioxygenase-like lactoylglutathione lyase family enzyme